jgi:hypothetical protein
VLQVSDGGVFAEGAGFHAQLLAQANEATDDRKSVTSDDLYGQLDELRAFPHRERDNYRFVLREELVNRNLDLLKAAFPTFEAEVLSFISEWEAKPADDGPQPAGR